MTLLRAVFDGVNLVLRSHCRRSAVAAVLAAQTVDQQRHRGRNARGARRTRRQVSVDRFCPSIVRVCSYNARPASDRGFAPNRQARETRHGRIWRRPSRRGLRKTHRVPRRFDAGGCEGRIRDVVISVSRCPRTPLLRRNKAELRRSYGRHIREVMPHHLHRMNHRAVDGREVF